MPNHSRFLVFSRNYILADLQKSFEPFAHAHEFAYLTDGASSIGPDTREIFYAALRDGAICEELDASDVDDVTARCRLLRNLPRAQAERLIHAMATALVHHIDMFRPDALISQMVDEYVSHLYAIMARKRGLGYLGYCAGYFPGTSLLLADAHGRPYNWRTAQPSEAQDQLDRVSDQDFRQTYNLGAGYSLPRHLKSLLRYRVKLAWFGLRGWLEKDPWNLHYRQTPHIAERRHLRDYPAAAMFSSNWRAELAELKRQRPNARTIYMPLSYFPESTIDYWVLDRRMIDYGPMIMRIAQTLSRDHIVVVKEHLHMMGARDGGFLKTLSAIKGVVSVPPLESSNRVVAESDLVLLGSGSPGIEATLRGKPVATFCDTSYWFAPSRAAVVDPGEVDSWPDELVRAIDQHQPLDGEGKLRFIDSCLAASTRVVESKTIWPVLHPEDVGPLLADLAARRSRR